MNEIYIAFSILPFMVSLFWTIILVLEWRNSYEAKRLLAVFMGVCSILYLCHAVFFNAESWIALLADSIYAFCNLAVYPLYYLYIARLTDMHSLTKKHVVLILLPAIFIGVWAAVLNMFFPHDIAYRTIRLSVSKIMFLLVLFPICYFGYKRLKNFDLKIENFYSNTEMRNVKITRELLIVLLVFSVCSGIANLIGREYFSNNPLIIIPSFVFSSLLFAVAYVGVKQKYCIDDFEKETFDFSEFDEGPNVTGKSTESMQPLLSQLENLMYEDKLYLQPDLRLTDVADHLGVSRSTLSSTINQAIGMSFSDYVNSYRIRCAQDIMSNQRQANNLSITQIYEQSGFSTESSFYRAFRKISGLTPKQWLEKA